VLVALDGEGDLVSERDACAVRRGDTFVVPAGFGDWEARGPLRIVVARPGDGWPAPGPGGAA
jgi:hypothetical protein